VAGAGYLSNLLTWLGDWSENKPRVRQAFKTTIAACLAYLIADGMELPQAFWAAVVAIFVTQANIGASLGQALDWFLGSLVGVVVGGAVAVLVGNGSDLRLIASLAGTVFALSYFAALMPQMRIACVNAAIIILGSSAFGTPIESAGIRMFEVVIGTIVAILTMLLVFPSRAGPALATHISRTLPLYFGLLSDLLEAMLTGRYDQKAVLEINAKIRAAVATNDALSAQVQTEVAGFLADNPDPEALLTALRRLWHTELMLARAVSAPLPSTTLSKLRGGVEELREAVEGLRRQVDEFSAHKEHGAAHIESVQAAIAKLSASITAMRGTEELRRMPMDDAVRLMTFDFALEQLRQNLKDLANRSKDFTRFVGTPGSWMQRLRGLPRP